MRVLVRDFLPECKAFAEKRGFEEVRHTFAMELDLDRFNQLRYTIH